MQLKMTNKFNFTLVKQLLQEEDKFLSDVFSKVSMPMSESEEYEESGGEKRTQEKKAKLFNANGKVKRAQTSEELYQKFNELKGQKKLTYKQKQLRKGLKNRIKKKSKREERLIQKKLTKTEQNTATHTTRSTIGIVTSDIKQESETLAKVPRAKPVFNSEGHMVFSKFDFSNIGNKKKTHKSEKDPKKILQKLKEKKQKLNELVESGEKAKAEEMKEKESWKTAIAKAAGEKIKDDPELLTRTIKREEQLKKRSAKKWDSRIANVDKAKHERQRKRQENIMKRKKEKKTNKLKKASKKGRIIPGF